MREKITDYILAGEEPSVELWQRLYRTAAYVEWMTVPEFELPAAETPNAPHFD